MERMYTTGLLRRFSRVDLYVSVVAKQIMEFETICISGYRSLDSNVRLNLEPQITTLVGPNESGKSNLISALSKCKVNPKYSDSDRSYISEEEMEIIIEISSTPINNILEDIVKTRQRLYNDESIPNKVRLSIELADNNPSIVEIDSPDIISVINERRHEELRNVVEFIKNKEDLSPPGHLISTIENMIYQDDIRMSKEKDYLNSLKKWADAELEDSEFDGLVSVIEWVSYSPAQLILQSIPDVQYYDEAQTVEDERQISELEEGDFYYELLRYAELEPDEFNELDPISRRNIRELASKELTELFNEFWRQEDIDFKIEFGNGTVSLLIANKDDDLEDGELRNYDLPSYRSEGFRYFLSFFVKILANSDNLLEDNLILLDDAGTHLHPDAQKDLRASLERLAEDNQVVMATHSPFLINGDDTSEIRLVDTQGEGEGTRVLEKMSQHDASGDDAFASVRAVIGAGFADSLFANKRNVLVEGTTDETYLKAFSKYFESRDGPALNPEKTAVVDSMGASKMGKYGKIFYAEGYDFVCLFDSDKEGIDHSGELREDYNIGTESIHLLDESIKELQEYNAEIEDLVSVDVYFDAVADSHDQIGREELEAMDRPETRQTTNQINREFGPRTGGINKRAVADTIAEWTEEDPGQIDEETVQNFEALITDLLHKLGDDYSTDSKSQPESAIVPHEPVENGQ
ncbi:AAA family ATPase [Haloarcula nitratireducens]|uniref:AAA family ATPase n=1 Tax=Haloarcula nitratireducens TaxID=2487749 RepID=A0AAW4PIG0_9EURY|nr:AAA family ATPase [Halomicroarcula nitratireducens]MBX0296997.1 AAA family ATPase [Halomicroarcula nitratireducens]